MRHHSTGPLRRADDAGDEEGRRPGELAGRPALDHLVQGAEAQPCAGQVPVEGRHTERQRGPPHPPAGLETRDLPPEILTPAIGKRHPLPGTQHAQLRSPHSCVFTFCSRTRMSQSAADCSVRDDSLPGCSR